MLDQLPPQKVHTIDSSSTAWMDRKRACGAWPCGRVASFFYLRSIYISIRCAPAACEPACGATIEHVIETSILVIVVQ